MTRRRCQRARVAPSAMESREQRARRNTDLLCPIRRAECDAVMRHESVAAPVSVLVVARCPSAVVRAVAIRIVLALYAHAWRAIAHVGMELNKARVPFRTDRNTPAAVTLVGVGLRVIAAETHRGPCDVGPRSAAGTCRQSVTRAPSGNNLFAEAAATLRPSAQEMVGARLRGLAARAAAMTEAVAIHRSCGSDNGEASEDRACQVVHQGLTRGKRNMCATLQHRLFRQFRPISMPSPIAPLASSHTSLWTSFIRPATLIVPYGMPGLLPMFVAPVQIRQSSTATSFLAIRSTGDAITYGLLILELYACYYAGAIEKEALA